LSSLVAVQQGVVTMQYGNPRHVKFYSSMVEFYTSIVDIEAIPTHFLALENHNTDYDVIVALVLLDVIGLHS
jgi:hypothetical protein